MPADPVDSPGPATPPHRVPQRTPPSASLTLLLGGVRSGKSARAVELAERWSPEGRVLFVATAQALDADMERRIRAHRSERPAVWETLESPLELVEELHHKLTGPHAGRHDVVVVDCLTLWVSNILLAMPEGDDAEQEVGARVAALVEAIRGSPPARWILVSNEVGLGVVPPTTLGRQYRDALGRANRVVAAAANEVTLMVAGLELRLR